MLLCAESSHFTLEFLLVLFESPETARSQKLDALLLVFLVVRVVATALVVAVSYVQRRFRFFQLLSRLPVLLVLHFLLGDRLHDVVGHFEQYLRHPDLDDVDLDLLLLLDAQAGRLGERLASGRHELGLDELGRLSTRLGFGLIGLFFFVVIVGEDVLFAL